MEGVNPTPNPQKRKRIRRKGHNRKQGEDKGGIPIRIVERITQGEGMVENEGPEHEMSEALKEGEHLEPPSTSNLTCVNTLDDISQPDHARLQCTVRISSGSRGQPRPNIGTGNQGTAVIPPRRSRLRQRPTAPWHSYLYKQRMIDKHWACKKEFQKLKDQATKQKSPVPQVQASGRCEEVQVEEKNIMWHPTTQSKDWVTVELQIPSYLDFIPKKMTLLIEEQKGPMSKYSSSDFGKQMILVAQTEVWYPRRDSRNQMTGGWVRRAVWGMGVYQNSGLGHIEVQLPELQKGRICPHLHPRHTLIHTNLSLMPYGSELPSPFWCTQFNRPGSYGLCRILDVVYGSTSHDDLPSQDRMTLSVKIPYVVSAAGSYNWYEMRSRMRAHLKGDGHPLAVDATEASDTDLRWWLAKWLGKVLPFDTRSNLGHRLPKSLREERLPTTERRHLALEAERRLRLHKTTRAEGDDMPRLSPISEATAALSELSLGGHLPEEDVVKMA